MESSVRGRLVRPGRFRDVEAAESGSALRGLASPGRLTIAASG